MVKIRLTRHGAKKNPFYRIVVADGRYPRDGRNIAMLAITTLLPSRRKSRLTPRRQRSGWLTALSPLRPLKSCSRRPA